MLFKNADVKRAQQKFTTIISDNMQVQRQTKLKLEEQPLITVWGGGTQGTNNKHGGAIKLWFCEV